MRMATFAAESNGEKDLVADNKESLEKSNGQSETRVYARRWLILGLFCLYTMTNAYQWIHLNIIFDVLKVYYNESLPGDDDQQSLAIDWLSMVFMLAYIPLIFPVTWLLDRKGLRVIALLGTFLNALGAWIKCTAVASDRFMVLMAAQTVCSIAQVFILGMPARVAAVWFGPDQVSTATSLGVFGNQLGTAVGFVLPPYVVKVHEDLSITGRSLSYLFYGGAGYTTLLFILVLFLFQKEPSMPPSLAQQKIVEAAAHENYLASLKRLVKNSPFNILVITYGLNVGVYYALSTLLNPIILGFFKVNCGWIGLTLVIAGLLGAVLGGIWLDKTKLFKVTTAAIYALTFVCTLAFTFTLYLNKIWVVYITSGLVGFFMTGYLPVGFEFAAELTYPESEGTSSGLLNASAQMFGIILTLSMGALMRLKGGERENIRNALLVACGILLGGGALTIAIRNNLYRQRAEKDDKDGKTEGSEKVTSS
ncbi:heme transporter FLVCR2-like isoform X2 [Watersipora subatra]|uniref:heme transporter FLVCR2-like isoform X2 n=1 Tax=Watersipora subatra TaxID=2589382 RepID=UPI00355B117A